MFFNTFAVLSEGSGTTGTPSLLPTLLMIGGLILVFYFFMIRPQKKRQKEEEKMRNNLQIGDEILTIGGFYFKVVSIKEDSLVVESTADHSKHRVAKWAVQHNMTIHDEA